ncbi:MAG: hypothetical protein JJU29_01690 [Verrucomicrobia bacterium]|nr:hypothetical protein [Verrucomicrobiota bacterium]MCH8510945.1 hypothetical protein [Kiritimatiellia bacterium]
MNTNTHSAATEDLDYQALFDSILAGTASEQVFDMVHESTRQRKFSDLVKAEHAERLVELGHSEHLKVRGAAWRLMRTICSEPIVRLHLQEIWTRKDLSDLERNTLLWRLLDDPELPTTLHRDIWEWIKSNRDSFVAAYIEYVDILLNGPEKKYTDNYACLADSIENGRLPNPLSKRWIYVATGVICAKNAQDRASAKALMARYSDLLKGTFYDSIQGELMKHSAQEVMK